MKKLSKPSLVDVLLTNKPRYCCNALNFGCGVSDWHNLVGVMIKGTSARVEKRRVQYRSFKGFDEKQFCSDVGQIPFDAAYVFDDVDDIYWAHEWLLTEVIDEHAPIKSRVVKSNKPPYMNDDLKESCI